MCSAPRKWWENISMRASLCIAAAAVIVVVAINSWQRFVLHLYSAIRLSSAHIPLGLQRTAGS